MEIYTLGGGETLIDILNAVALLVGSRDWAALAKISFMVSLIVVAFMSLTGNPFWSYAKQFGILLLMYWVLFLPTTTVTVTDKLEPGLAGNTVANVPWGLAFFASSASRIGDSFTTLSETVFSLPNDLNYQRNGFIFGSALMEKITTARINNGNFKASIHSFAANCIFYEINIGTYSWEDIRTSENIWQFVSADNAPSPAVAFEYTNPANGNTSIETCATGSTYLTAYWSTATDNMISKISRQLRPRLSSADANTEILGAIPVATDYMIGLSETAANTMRQAMMIAGIKGGMQEYAANADATAAVTAANAERAALQTAMAQQLAGKQAQTFVPLLRTIFEIIFYAMFPFTIIMLVLPQTMAGLKSYFSLFVGLQIWGPMFVVLHRLMMSHAATATTAASAVAGGGDGLTYASINDMAVVQSEIANLAGYLSLSIPFLAGAFGFGSAKLGSLATSTLSSFQRASDQVAAQASHGQYQLGTTSQGVHAYNNTTGNRVLTSGSYDTSQTSTRMNSGALRTFSEDGSYATDTSQMGSRSGHHNYRMSEGIASSINQAASVQHSQGQSERSQATDSQVAGLSRMMQSVGSRNVSMSNSQSLSEAQTASRKNAIEETEAVTNNISEKLGVDNNTAAQIAAFGGVEGSFDAERIPGPIAKIAEAAGLGLKANLGLKAQASASQVANELFSVGKDATQSLRESGTLDNLQRFSQDGSLNFTDGKSNSLNSQINADFAKSRQHTEMSEAHFANERSLSEQATLQQNNSLSGDYNQNDELINYMAQQVSPMVGGNAPMGKSGALSLFESQKPDDQSMVRDYARNFQEEKSEAIIADTIGQFRQENGLENPSSLRSDYTDSRENYATNAPKGNEAGGAVVIDSVGNLADREIDTSLKERAVDGKDSITNEIGQASNQLGQTRAAEASKVKDEIATTPVQFVSDPFDTAQYLSGVTDIPGGEIGNDFKTNILDTNISTPQNQQTAFDKVSDPSSNQNNVQEPNESKISDTQVDNVSSEPTSPLSGYRDVGLPVDEYVPNLQDTEISRSDFLPTAAPTDVPDRSAELGDSAMQFENNTFKPQQQNVVFDPIDFNTSISTASGDPQSGGGGADSINDEPVHQASPSPNLSNDVVKDESVNVGSLGQPADNNEGVSISQNQNSETKLDKPSSTSGNIESSSVTPDLATSSNPAVPDTGTFRENNLSATNDQSVKEGVPISQGTNGETNLNIPITTSGTLERSETADLAANTNLDVPDTDTGLENNLAAGIDHKINGDTPISQGTNGETNHNTPTTDSDALESSETADLAANSNLDVPRADTGLEGNNQPNISHSNTSDDLTGSDNNIDSFSGTINDPNSEGKIASPSGDDNSVGPNHIDKGVEGQGAIASPSGEDFGNWFKSNEGNSGLKAKDLDIAGNNTQTSNNENSQEKVPKAPVKNAGNS